jgi:hypothetical protein
VRTRIFASLAAILLAALISGCEKSAPPTLNDQATIIALNIVSNSLIAPTTAKFSAVSCVERADHTFLISGQVDSQNVFGAMLRKEFDCVLTNLGNDKLDWLGVSVGGDATINQNLIPQDVKLLDSRVVVSTDETSLQKQQYKHVEGRIQNLSQHTLTFISITYNLFETDGTLNGTSHAYLSYEKIPPNGIWNFTTDSFDVGLTPKFVDMTSSP